MTFNFDDTGESSPKSVPIRNLSLHWRLRSIESEKATRWNKLTVKIIKSTTRSLDDPFSVRTNLLEAVCLEENWQRSLDQNSPEVNRLLLRGRNAEKRHSSSPLSDSLSLFNFTERRSCVAPIHPLAGAGGSPEGTKHHHARMRRRILSLNSLGLILLVQVRGSFMFMWMKSLRLGGTRWNFTWVTTICFLFAIDQKWFMVQYHCFELYYR